MARRHKIDRQAYLTALCRTVPYHVVEPVLANPTEHAISHRSVEGSLLFADLVGLTPLCERMARQGSQGLSKLSSILDQLFELLLEKGIFPYSGYVIHFGGDSMSVVFQDQGYAQRCAASALSLQQLMDQEVRRLLGQKQRVLMLRIGVASGTIKLPVIGDLARRAVVCAGVAAHRALQLQQFAQPTEIFVDQNTRQALGKQATTLEQASGFWLLQELHSWPKRKAIVELGDRICSQTDEKIALLEPFVPQPLAMRLRTTPNGWRLEGELRELTILVAEIWGLDGAEAPPELAMRIARSIPRALHKYGGIASKADLAPRGHRITGLFGLSSPTEHDAERAILAALECTSRIKGLTTDGTVDITLRVGVHMGKVYYGAIGSTYRHDITAVGEAVHTAHRTVAAAEPFQILCTDQALMPVQDRFEYSERGPLRIKESSPSHGLYVIHGASSQGAHYIQKRGKTRYLAGRTQEQKQLQSICDQALGGTPHMVGLCGGSGTGRSVMLSAVIDRWVDSGGYGVLGRCSYATRSNPLAPVVNMFASFLGFSSQDTDAFRRDRLRYMLSNFDISIGARELISLLQPVQRPDGSTESELDLADTQARERVLTAIVHFVKQRLQQSPILYIVEDFHFADSLTQQLAIRLAALAGKYPFLGILTYQPDPLLRDLRKATKWEIVLNNLTQEQTADLVCHELYAEHIAPELNTFLWRRTQGNPAHLVEVVRFLVDRQMIRVRAGTVVPSGSGLELLEQGVPQTMAHVALAQLDTLGEVERRLLKTASAIGRRFRRTLLERVSASDMEPDLLEAAIASLETQRVLTPEKSEQPGYLFRDDIIRTVTYETIPENERRQVHSRIADALERAPEADPRRTTTALALHRERAGQWQQALTWYRRAIDLTASLAMHRETLDLIERFEAIVPKLERKQRPESDSAAQLEIYKLIATAQSGEPAATIAVGRTLSQTYADLLDSNTQAKVDFWLGHALAELGKPEKGRARLKRAFQTTAERQLKCDAACAIANTYAKAQQQKFTEQWLQVATDHAGEDLFRQARIALARAQYLLYTGELDQAREIFSQVLSKARERGDLVNAAIATSDLARCALANCQFTQAQKGFGDAIQLDRALGNWSQEAFDRLHLGQAFLWSGDPDSALSPLEQALAVVREMGNTSLESEALVHLGAAIALTRDPVEGQAMCEEGYKKAVRSDIREVEIAADLHLLRIALLQKDQQAILDAVERCSTHDMAPPLYRKVFAELSQKAEICQ